MGSGAHDDAADHAGLEVTGNQAGELEFTGAVERPDDLAALPRVDMGHVGFVVGHVGEFFHHFGVGAKLFRCADDDFVQCLAGIDRHQTHGLAQLHVQGVGAEAHVIRHADFDGAAYLLGLACDAPGGLLRRRGLGVVVWGSFAYLVPSHMRLHRP